MINRTKIASLAVCAILSAAVLTGCEIGRASCRERVYVLV